MRSSTMSWIVICNTKDYDIVPAFKKLDRILWKQEIKVKKGDIVYIYLTAPFSEIRYKCMVTRIDLPERITDDSEFVLNGESYLNCKNYMELEKLGEYKFLEFKHSKLKQHGLGSVQQAVKMNGELSEYIASVIMNRRDNVIKTKSVIADVHYTASDETYYVLNGISRFDEEYKANSLREAFSILRANGWNWCGKVVRSDEVPVDMFRREGYLIAVWQEVDIQDEEQEEEEMLKGLGCLSEGVSNKKVTYREEPRDKKPPVYRNGNRVYLRNRKISRNALCMADFKCEVDESHPTFIRKYSPIPYTEPHHLVPMEYSDEFDVSLDVEENIVSLCSNCHNLLHYGRDAEEILKKLYEQRKELLQKAGIDISWEELRELYL